MNRLTVLAVAALVAIASGLGLVRYVSGAEDRALAAAEPVPVLVAAADVSEGTRFEDAWADGDIVESQIQRRMRPSTAILNTEELSGMVSDGTLRAGQLVVGGVFVDPSEAEDANLPPTFADSLPEGTVAVSFDAAGAQAVSDLISPGDRVDLFVQVPNAADLGLPDSGGPAVVQAFTGLKVIAIGAALAPQEGAEAPVANPGAGSYTVAVAPADAGRLLLLTRQYEVSLTLVGPGADSDPQDPITAANVLPKGTVATTVPGAGRP